MTIAIQGIANLLVEEVDNLNMFDPSLFRLVDTVILPDGSRETTYQLVDEDPVYPTSVRLGYYPKTDKDGAFFNVSLRISTFAVRTEGDIVESRPATCVIAFTMPWVAVPDADEVMSMLSLAYSWLVRDVTAGSLTSGFLLGLGYGVTDSSMASVVRTDA